MNPVFTHFPDIGSMDETQVEEKPVLWASQYRLGNLITTDPKLLLANRFHSSIPQRNKSGMKSQNRRLGKEDYSAL